MRVVKHFPPLQHEVDVEDGQAGHGRHGRNAIQPQEQLSVPQVLQANENKYRNANQPDQHRDHLEPKLAPLTSDAFACIRERSRDNVRSVTREFDGCRSFFLLSSNHPESVFSFFFTLTRESPKCHKRRVDLYEAVPGHQPV